MRAREESEKYQAVRSGDKLALLISIDAGVAVVISFIVAASGAAFGVAFVHYERSAPPSIRVPKNVKPCTCCNNRAHASNDILRRKRQADRQRRSRRQGKLGNPVGGDASLWQWRGLLRLWPWLDSDIHFCPNSMADPPHPHLTDLAHALNVHYPSSDLLGDGRVDSVDGAREHLRARVPDNAQDGYRNQDADDRISEGISCIYAERTD